MANKTKQKNKKQNKIACVYIQVLVGICQVDRIIVKSFHLFTKGPISQPPLG